MRTPEELESVLRIEIDRARSAYEQAKWQREPSMQAFTKALGEFNDFVLKGRIPERLREPFRSEAAASTDS